MKEKIGKILSEWMFFGFENILPNTNLV